MVSSGGPVPLALGIVWSVGGLAIAFEKLRGRRRIITIPSIPHYR